VDVEGGVYCRLGDLVEESFVSLVTWANEGRRAVVTITKFSREYASI